MLLLASVVSVLFSDTTAVAQNETKQLSLLEQPVWSENNNSFKLSLSIKHLDEGDLIEIYTLEELNRNSLKESFISKNSEPTENSFQITLTQEQIIKKEITVELNTNSPTNNSVFSEPGTVRPLIVKSYTSDQKNSETLVFPLIHLPKTEKLNTISLAFIFEINAKPPLQHDGTYIIDRETITQLTNLVETLKNNPEIKITISLPPATLSSLSQSKNPKDELLLLDIKNLAETQLHIISSPFVTSDPEAWRLIDRFETYNDLLNRGDRQLTNQLQIEPDRSFSFVANSAVIETLDALNKVGIKTFITEFSHIDPTPENKIDPFISLQGDNGKVFKVFILDDTINFYLNKLENKNSDMQFLLGDLSLIAMDENKKEKNLIVKIPNDLSGNLLNQFLTTLQNFPKINIKALPNLVDHAEKNQKVDKTKYVLWNKSPQDISTRAPNQNLAKAAIRAYSEVINLYYRGTIF